MSDELPDPWSQAEQHLAEVVNVMALLHRECTSKGLSVGLADVLVRDWHWAKCRREFGLDGSQPPGEA